MRASTGTWYIFDTAFSFSFLQYKHAFRHPQISLHSSMQSLQECICNAVQQVAVVRGVPVEEQSHIQAFCAEEYYNDSQAKVYTQWHK